MTGGKNRLQKFARAYEKIQAAEAAGDPIKGPKKLCMFGAPYIWGILKGTGLI